ncbi:MAG: metalloprotease, partial [Myxococcales bacterium]
MSQEVERGAFELHFRLGAFPIVVEPMFWLSMGLLGAMGRPPDARYVLVFIAIAFFAVLVHELGHAVAARIFGATSVIRLHGFGGVTLSDRALGRWQNVLMSLAGPVAGFLLGSAVMLLEHLQPPETRLAAFFVNAAKFTTFGWGILNLIPVLPLDGSHVLLGLF